MKAVWIIRDEHRRYGAVLGMVRQLLSTLGAGPTTVDLGLIGLAFDYVADFVGNFHHPKEDEYLFRKVRARTSGADAILNELEEQHVRGEHKLTEIRAMLQTLQREPTLERFAKFKAAVLSYIDFETAHAMLESRNLLPIAERVLTSADWAEIDAAFLDNDDPVFGAAPRRKFERLLQEIANRAPAPHGYGPEPGTAITGARWPLG